MTLEPTSKGDMTAHVLRDWYERNREGWLARHSLFGAGPDRSGLHADEFMIGLFNEALRISRLTDDELINEVGQ